MYSSWPCCLLRSHPCRLIVSGNDGGFLAIADANGTALFVEPTPFKVLINGGYSYPGYEAQTQVQPYPLDGPVLLTITGPSWHASRHAVATADAGFPCCARDFVTHASCDSRA